MRSVFFEQCGAPIEVLRFREDAPKPTPARGQVLVRMLASPINPSDLLYIEGRYGLKPQLPATPGFEGVGIVEASGGGILGWLRQGKRVAIINDRHGNWQEYTLTSARQVIPVPPEIPDDQAATFFVNPATALAMIRHVLRPPPGAWLLQSAAGSALGKMILQLSRLDGFRTINWVRRPEQVDELRRLGATEVLCVPPEELPEQVHRLTGGAGVPFAIDPVGGAVGSAVVRSLGTGGRALLYGLLSGEPISVDPRFLLRGSKRVEGFWLADWVKQQRIPKLVRLFRQIRKLLQHKTFQTEIAGTYPLDRIHDAVRHATTMGRNGKILLRIDSSSADRGSI